MLFGFMGMDDGTEAQGNNRQKNLSAFSFSLHNRDESQGIGAFDFLNGGLGASADETGKNAFDFFGGMNRTENFDFMSGIEGVGDKDSTQGGFNFDFQSTDDIITPSNFQFEFYFNI